MSDVVMPVYKRSPITFTHGKGPWLYDDKGNEYLDALSGIAVTVLGHNHPAVTKAIMDQAQKVLHVSNGYEIPEQTALAKRITQLAGMTQAFFCNSGAEANEAAIKIARLYGHNKGIDNPQIIVMEKSFHGRTMATLSASGNRKIQAGFEPLVQGFVRAPYNDLTAIKTLAHNNPDIVAVMLEPILGNGGIVLPDAGYIAGLRAICDKHNWLLILDEVQTGIAHTGKMFAFQHENIIPDVLCIAKALGNGIPIGACLAHGAAVDVIQPGKHGTTLGGNPFACRVGITVLDTLVNDKLVENTAKLGDYILKAFKETLAKYKFIKTIRGRGLMFGIELDHACPEIKKIGLKHKILFNVTAENTIRLLPPSIITQNEADEIVKRIAATFEDYKNEHRSHE